MKKKVLSLLFACIMIVSVFAFAGCKSDELQAQIDENATKAETAVNDAAAKAAKDLADADAALKALIAAGDEADAKALADAVTKLNTAIDAAKTASTSADDALKAELTAAIAAAKTELSTGANTALEAAVKKLNDAVALKVDTAAYNKAVADLDAAVKAAQAAAEKFAKDADAALKEELVAADKKVAEDLTKAIATAKSEALTEAKAYVDAKVEELKGIDAADKKELAAAIQEAKDAAAAADEAAKKAAVDAATTADGALKADLEEKIAALEEAIKGANTSAGNAWGEWNEATDAVIEKLAALRKAEKAFERADYYDLLDEAVINKAIDIVAETETKLLRAINKAAVEAEYVYANDFFATIDGVFAAFNGYKMEYYYAEQQEELKAALADALKAIEATTDESDVPAIKTALEADLDAVLNRAEFMIAALTADGDPMMAVILNEKWEKLLADVDYKLNNEDKEVAEALKFADVAAKYNEYQDRYDLLVHLKSGADAYNADNKALAEYLSDAHKYDAHFNKDSVAKYYLFLEKVDAWFEALGETNEENKKMLDATILEEMKANFNARKKGHEDYAAKLLSDLNKFGAADYVYLYSAELEAEVFALHANYLAFKEYVVVKMGYELGEEYHVAFNTFVKENGTYTRALAIQKAKAEADGINAAVEDLTKILNHLTTFKTEYQDKMEAIDLAVEAWKKAYFVEHYAAEAVAGNANYDLLKHTAYADLQALYAEKLGAIEEAMKKVTETFNAEGFKTINLLSKDEIDAAKAAWDALIKLVGDLGLNTKEITVGHIDLIKGEATTDQIADLIDTQTLAFKAACEAAYKDYKLLNHPVLDATLVTIYDEKSVAQMVDWYKKYLGIDPSDAASVLPADGVDLVLSEADKVVMTVELYDAAKATCTAWKTMTDAKKEAKDALVKDIADFLAGTINTESRAAYDALMKRWIAYVDGSTVPAPYASEQYKVADVDADLYFVDITELEKAGATIKTLEDERDNLFKFLDLLASDDYINDTLLNVDLADVNKDIIDALEADMIAFTKKNADFNCFVESEGTEYTNREVIIDQSREIIEIALIYDEAITKVESIGNDAVKTDLKARALEARKAALDLILTLDPAEWADSDAYAVEKAKLEIVKNTINSYLKYAPEKGEDKMAERYENTVKSHMAKATVDALAALELTGKGVDDMISEISYSIDDAFAKIGTTTVTP